MKQLISVRNVYPITVIPKRCTKARTQYIADVFQVGIDIVDTADVELIAEWNEELQYNDETYVKRLYRYKHELYSQAIKMQPAGVNSTIFEVADLINHSERENLLDSSSNSPFHGHHLAAVRIAQQGYKKLVKHEDVESQGFREVLDSGKEDVQASLDHKAKNYIIVDGHLLEREQEPRIEIHTSGHGFVSVRMGLGFSGSVSTNHFGLNKLEEAKTVALKRAKVTDDRGTYQFPVVESVKDSFERLDIKLFSQL